MHHPIVAADWTTPALIHSRQHHSRFTTFFLLSSSLLPIILLTLSSFSSLHSPHLLFSLFFSCPFLYPLLRHSCSSSRYHQRPIRIQRPPSFHFLCTFPFHNPFHCVQCRLLMHEMQQSLCDGGFLLRPNAH